MVFCGYGLRYLFSAAIFVLIISFPYRVFSSVKFCSLSHLFSCFLHLFLFVSQFGEEFYFLAKYLALVEFLFDSLSTIFS